MSRARNIRRMTTLGLTVVLAILSWLAERHQIIPTALTNNQPGLYHVTKVVDGDTIEVSAGGAADKVRFIGVDTPETSDPRKPVQCFAQAAKSKTTSLLTDQNVKLVPDPEDSDRDKYHRLLRYVYLPDGTLINAELVKQGYAFAYKVFPFTKLDEFTTLEQQARTAGAGLWSGCSVHLDGQIEQTNPQSQ